jgi:hypothetical protein
MVTIGSCTRRGADRLFEEPHDSISLVSHMHLSIACYGIRHAGSETAQDGRGGKSVGR